MKILHGIWTPRANEHFVQNGDFYLWGETTQPARKKANHHPFQLHTQEWQTLIDNELGLKTAFQPRLTTQSILLPTVNQQPLPSPELSRYRESTATIEDITLQRWRINCYPLEQPIKQINEIYFLTHYGAVEIQLGSDLLFWHYFTQSLKRLIYKDHYIPALIYRQTSETAKTKTPKYELYAGWRWASSQYHELIHQAVEKMPDACAAGASAEEGALSRYNKESLLRHCAECLLESIICGVAFPATLAKKTEGSLLESACNSPRKPWKKNQGLELYQQWRQWCQHLTAAFAEIPFHLGFQLQEAAAERTEQWYLRFLVIFKHDPTLQLSLSDYWSLPAAARHPLPLGEDFETQLLLNLGYAARMYPKIQTGLETAEPTGCALTLDEAAEFIQENAWVLEDAGFRVLVPAWWTPQGRRRVKIRLRAASSQTSVDPILSLEKLIQYRYELAIDDQRLTEAEWQQLVNAKSSLIHFRGQWMILDRDQMAPILAFWAQHGHETPQVTVQELLHTTADDIFELDPEDALANMLAGLHDQSQLLPVETPAQLNGELRDYQKRGVAWLNYLEQLGLNGCLADDMGLGKTVQVIAQLMREREANTQVAPTLLIAPTSVLGNWQKEVEKFAPQLKTLLHHGPKRQQEPKVFKEHSRSEDMVITSYTLVRKDEKLFNAVNWRRIVLDEAHTIKNPKTAQSRAIFKLKANHRLALTGTPIENRLMDLWTLFNFLNPGYFGTQAHFRKTFELPVQRDNDPVKTATLKRLVEPFILRRLKTDNNIIKDLPAKVENKQYCNLSTEQASLYAAVVQDVEQKLETLDGIERQGLMLSTLMKLKQICNHPTQFLQDGGAFTPERSHKLERLTEMLAEIIAEQDSVLIFTQFTEIGANLERYLKHTLYYNVYYLHGGVQRARREQMIAQFQDPDTQPSIFVLSVKAGGVGVTLTKANHVFHFDRWWNPAVEDQATDRAFRIGQKKNVFVHKFITLGTLEERIDQMIENKKIVANAVVGASESWLTQLDNQHFKELIALNKDMVVD